MSKKTTALSLKYLTKHINAIKEAGHKPRPSYQFISHIEMLRLTRW